MAAPVNGTVNKQYRYTTETGKAYIVKRAACQILARPLLVITNEETSAVGDGAKKIVQLGPDNRKGRYPLLNMYYCMGNTDLGGKLTDDDKSRTKI